MASEAEAIDVVGGEEPVGSVTAPRLRKRRRGIPMPRALAPLNPLRFGLHVLVDVTGNRSHCLRGQDEI